MDQALRPRDKDAKQTSKGGYVTIHYLYIILTFLALIAVVAMLYLSKVSLEEMFVT